MDANERLRDCLRELGNIGCGHALAALAKMTSKTFLVRVPEIELLDYADVPARLGDAEAETVAVMLDVTGGLRGVFLLLLRPQIAVEILRALGMREPCACRAFSPRQRGALMEIGNIMCGAYMTAVADMTALEIRHSVPALASDMLGAILSVPLARFADADARTLYIQNIFTIETRDWAGCTILLPDLVSARTLGDRLGAMR